MGYADDLGIVVVDKDIRTLERKANQAIDNITEWLSSRRLKLAPQKTEAVLLVGGRKIRGFEVTVGDAKIPSQESVKYLGIHLNRNMSMSLHVKLTAEKATKALSHISRLMPNIGGPRENSRHILSNVVQSIILYGSSAWQRALNKKVYLNTLLSVQRKVAIRITSAYRTTSTKAILMIARTPPIDLLVEERSKIERGENKSETRETLLGKWQEKWDTDDGTANWTKRLIRDIKQWVDRKFGNVDYYLTQILTGHGGFYAYLHRFSLSNTDECQYCHQVDTAEHTLFECDRWKEERKKIEEKVGRITPENLIRKMLETEENWMHICKLAMIIMSNKRREMTVQA